MDTPTLGPGGTIQNGEKLIARLAHLGAALAGMVGSGTFAALRVSSAPADTPPLVLLGASTGGPEALATVLGTFPANLAASVLISQHIDSDFAPGLVQQLASRCKLPVRGRTPATPRPRVWCTSR